MTYIYPDITKGLKVRHRKTLEERTVSRVRNSDGAVFFEGGGKSSWLHHLWATYKPLPQPGDRVRVVGSKHTVTCEGREGTLTKVLLGGEYAVLGANGFRHEGPLSDFEVILPEVNTLAQDAVDAYYKPAEPETVSVPVEMVQRLIEAYGSSIVVSEIAALLPEPKPKWVMVTVDRGSHSQSYSRDWLDAQADAFDVIDTVIEEWWNGEMSAPDASDLKAAVRKAFEDGADK